MNENHRLLQEAEISHPKLDLLVDIARRNGAIGAKMTGGGRGGFMVALTPDDVQEKVALEMEKAGYRVLRATIGI